jgi:hypothetical protein
MPFVPFQKKSAAPDDLSVAPTAPSASTFSKKAFGKRKSRKAAPAQKSLMQSGRALGGGGR